MIWLYLDPGSGSFLIQLLIASIAGIVIFVGVSWRKVKKLFNKNKAETNESDNEDEDDDDDKND
jgi:hypothetical protein